MDYSRWAEMQRLQPSNPNPSSDHYAQLYNAQQSFSYAHPYSYHPLQTQNPTLVNTPILPPGIDPYAAINSHPPTQVGLEVQTAGSYGHHVAHFGAVASYYQDTGTSAQTWATNEPIRQFGADHMSYSSAIKESEVPMSSTPMVPNNYNHPIANDATKTVLAKSNVTQAVWCEVCKIECNSKDVYVKHTLGKRHQRNLKIGTVAAATAIMQSNTGTTAVGNFPGQASLRTNGTQTLVAANPSPLGRSNKLKTHPAVNGTWRKGAKKTKIVQSTWCEICRIDCNSKDVLENHKLGKKHKKNLEKLEESKTQASASAAGKAPMIGPKENPAAAEKGETKKKRAPPLGAGEDLETKRRKLMEGGAASIAVRVCRVCNVACNSQTVFNYHLAGQKHINMVKKQAEAAAAGTAYPSGSVVVNAA